MMVRAFFLTGLIAMAWWLTSCNGSTQTSPGFTGTSIPERTSQPGKTALHSSTPIEFHPDAQSPTPLTTVEGRLFARPASTAQEPLRWTLVPTATQTPWSFISITVVDCQTEGTFACCQDEILGLSFEIPASWGTIESMLFRGNTGLAYEYLFYTPEGRSTYKIHAGGRSKNFRVEREGTLTDFGGYEEGITSWRCELPSESPLLCEEIQENVLLWMAFPIAQYICEPAPGTFGAPYAMIEIELPNNRQINGFRFIAPFLSEEMSDELAGARRYYLGDPESGYARKCDSDNQADFDQWMAGFVIRVKSRDVDEATARNISLLEHLARSMALR